MNGLAGCSVSTIGTAHEYFDLTTSSTGEASARPLLSRAPIIVYLGRKPISSIEDFNGSNTLSKWIARGAMAGSILGGIDNLPALLTWFNPPLGLLLWNWGLLLSGGIVLGVLVAHTRGDDGDFGDERALFISGVAFLWLADKAVEAARFRGFASVLGLLALGLSILILLGAQRKILERSTPGVNPELSLASTVLLLSVWLVLGRHLTKTILGSYVSMNALVVNGLLAVALGLIYVALDRWLARSRVPSPRSTHMALASVAVSLGAIVGLWLFSQLAASRLDFETRGSVLVNDDVGTSVLLVSIDTLRADRLSVYGYPRTTTPFLEKLAKDSVVFEKVLSPASWTLPAHASLLTGKLPGRHGARFVGLPDGRHRGQCRLPPPQPRHGPGVRAL